jgi:hypothetical protein
MNPTGVQTPTVPDIFFFIDNWVSPMLPTHVVSRPGGVSNVDIDGNNAWQIKAIGVVISTFETLPKVPKATNAGSMVMATPACGSYGKVQR